MFEQELANLAQRHLLRDECTVLSAQGPRLAISGRGEVVNLCSNNYLGLAEHPQLLQAAAQALEKYGLGSGASRLVSGTMSLHQDLEARIAAFKGAEAAILFNSGHSANTGVIPALAGEGDVIFSDSLNHASIVDGCRLSRARTLIYRHCDGNHLASLLKDERTKGRKLIISDGVFSMDGDIAPIPDLAGLADRYGADLMIDDAHGTGVLGATGRGVSEHFGSMGRVAVQMGTFGKALGSFGAYVAGDRGLITMLRNSARSYMFSTSLPPAICAASIAALDLIDRESWRRERLWQNRKRFVEGIATLGFPLGDSATPIMPVMAGTADRAVEMSASLLQSGVFARAIRPPSVPEGTSRIRTTVMATHSEQDIDTALSAFRSLRSSGDHHG